MTFHDLVSATIHDAVEVSLPLYGPELAFIGTILVMLTLRVFRAGERIDLFYVALAGAALALWLSAPWKYLAEPAGVPRTEIFTGMLVFDGLTVFMRSLFALFTVLLILLMKITGMAHRDDLADIYTLILGATLGMCIMASANHLLIVLLGVEMASVPSYVLAGMLRNRPSSEAALKYSVYGAAAAGVMLYGISLLAGILHSAHLPTMAIQLAALDVAEMFATRSGMETLLVLVLGGLLTMVGLAFKLSAVPFHFWCPDVFDGAPAEIGAFLSVASKAAALALLVRVGLGLAAVPADHAQALVERTPPPVSAAAVDRDGFEVKTAGGAVERIDGAATARTAAAAPAVLREETLVGGAVASVAELRQRLAPSAAMIAKIIALLAAITCTFGNLAAYGQTNLKRLLAYSTIAHAGYMMMPVAAAVAMAAAAPQRAEVAVAAVAIYAAIYLFMNLGAFAFVAILQRQTGSDEIADYAGLIRRSPGVVVCLTATLFGLIGLPPLAGFVAKFAAFAALVDGYRVTGGTYLVVLLLIGGINTALSLFYYLRIVKIVTIDSPAAGHSPPALPIISAAGLYLVAVTVPTLLLILNWEGLSRWALAAAAGLLT